MKVFIDNNIVSLIAFSERKNKEELEATRNIWQSNNVSFWTTIKGKEEAIATRNEKKKQKLLEVHENIKQVPTRLTLSGGHLPQDADRTKLRDTFYEKQKEGFHAANTNDADHIFEAKAADCDFFLTLDKKMISKYRNNMDKVKLLIGKMEIVDPKTLWSFINKSNQV